MSPHPDCFRSCRILFQASLVMKLVLKEKTFAVSDVDHPPPRSEEDLDSRRFHSIPRHRRRRFQSMIPLHVPLEICAASRSISNGLT